MNGTAVYVYTCVCISVHLHNVFNSISWSDKTGNFLAPSFPLPLLSLRDFGSFKEYKPFVFEIRELLTYYRSEKVTGVLAYEALLWIDT